MRKFLGLDIGGANLKISDGEQCAFSEPFPLWKMPELLAERLRGLIARFDGVEGLAVTMTGELADCFETKAQGVDFILSAVEQAADGKPIFVWQTGAEFIAPEVAREIPLLVAAANWHALATFVGRMVPEGLSLLVDMGSTTTDIIPIFQGVPVPNGLTDRERLVSGELVYTGVARTPICAVLKAARHRLQRVPVAAEFFATTLDAYLLLEKIPEDPANTDTANGKPATKKESHDRIARMICCDRDEVSREDAVFISEMVNTAQKQEIMNAIADVLGDQQESLQHILISGSGSFLIEQICNLPAYLENIERISLGNVFQENIAQAACAFAVARLATERVPLG